MSEPRDDTPERGEPSRDEREDKPGSYYYDDSTGYEIYDPAKDDEDEDDEDTAQRPDTRQAHHSNRRGSV